MLGRGPADQRRGLAAQALLGGLRAVALRYGGGGGHRDGRRRTGANRGGQRGLRFLGGWSCRRRRRHRRHRRALVGLQDRDERLHGDGLPLLDLDLNELPRGGRRNLGVHLVGRDLEEPLVALYFVAELLEPLAERALVGAFAHLGHGYIDSSPA